MFEFTQIIKKMVKLGTAILFITALAACSGSTDTLTNTSDTGDQGSSNPPDTGNGNPQEKGSVTVNWLPPTQNNDNSALTDLSGYRIYYGTSMNDLSNTINITSNGITSFVIENLDVDSTYFFTIVAINSSNIESAPSNIASKTVSI